MRAAVTLAALILRLALPSNSSSESCDMGLSRQRGSYADFEYILAIAFVRDIDPACSGAGGGWSFSTVRSVLRAEFCSTGKYLEYVRDIVVES